MGLCEIQMPEQRPRNKQAITDEVLSEVQKKIYIGHRMTKPDTSRDIKGYIKAWDF